jgi:hypothetical protein
LWLDANGWKKLGEEKVVTVKWIVFGGEGPDGAAV